MEIARDVPREKAYASKWHAEIALPCHAVGLAPDMP